MKFLQIITIILLLLSNLYFAYQIQIYSRPETSLNNTCDGYGQRPICEYSYKAGFPLTYYEDSFSKTFLDSEACYDYLCAGADNELPFGQISKLAIFVNIILTWLLLLPLSILIYFIFRKFIFKDFNPQIFIFSAIISLLVLLIPIWTFLALFLIPISSIFQIAAAYDSSTIFPMAKFFSYLISFVASYLILKEIFKKRIG